MSVLSPTVLISFIIHKQSKFVRVPIFTASTNFTTSPFNAVFLVIVPEYFSERLFCSSWVRTVLDSFGSLDSSDSLDSLDSLLNNPSIISKVSLLMSFELALTILGGEIKPCSPCPIIPLGAPATSISNLSKRFFPDF